MISNTTKREYERKKLRSEQLLKDSNGKKPVYDNNWEHLQDISMAC